MAAIRSGVRGESVARTAPAGRRQVDIGSRPPGVGREQNPQQVRVRVDGEGKWGGFRCRAVRDRASDSPFIRVMTPLCDS